MGDDDQGRGLLAGDLDTSLVRVVKEARTAAYTAVLDAGGECKFGVGDMDIHGMISPDYLRGLEEEVAAAPLVVADGNMPQETILTLMELCHRHKGWLIIASNLIFQCQCFLSLRTYGRLTSPWPAPHPRP